LVAGTRWRKATLSTKWYLFTIGLTWSKTVVSYLILNGLEAKLHGVLFFSLVSKTKDLGKQQHTAKLIIFVPLYCRMKSLNMSCDNFPTCLVLINGNRVLGHCKISLVARSKVSCFIESGKQKQLVLMHVYEIMIYNIYTVLRLTSRLI